MKLNVCVLGSGSEGNCTCVWSENTYILIDDGFPLKRVEQFLRIFAIPADKISVLITHSHVDHCLGLNELISKYGVTVYASRQTKEEIIKRKYAPSESIVETDERDFFIGDVTVTPIEVMHDVYCQGYSLRVGGKTVSVVTDLGNVPQSIIDALSESDLLVLEANHDVDMLKANSAYPPMLKARILSDRGHLSNEATAKAVTALVKRGVKRFILAHLSQKNNLPELAYDTVMHALEKAKIESGVQIEVSHQDKPTGLYRLE